MMFDAKTLAPLAQALAEQGLPTLATILGEVVPFPFNLAVGPATQAIEAALGIDLGNAQAVQQAAQLPNLAKRLQPIEEAQTQAISTAQSELNARLADLQNARANQVQYIQSKSWAQFGPVVVSGIIVLSFSLLCLGLLFREIPNSPVSSALFGALISGFTAVIQFWLGSSQGSRAKDAVIADIVTPISGKGRK